MVRQNQEIEKLRVELANAKIELAFQIQEKEKAVAELVFLNKKTILQKLRNSALNCGPFVIQNNENKSEQLN